LPVNPASRAEAYAALDEARAGLMTAFRGLSPEEMTRPVLHGWSTKDLLAHIASWEEQVLPDLERLQRGHTPALTAFNPGQVDEWNAMHVGLRRNFGVDQVLFELEDSRRRLVEALDSLGDDAFISGYVPATCGITSGHDREHAAHIRAWRQSGS
jgi:hypothetical protein